MLTMWLVKRDMSITDCMNAKRTGNKGLGWQETSSSTSSNQSLAEEGWFGQEVLISQKAPDEGGRHTKKWVIAVAIGGSLKGAPGKYAAIGYGIVQLCFDHAGEPRYGEDGTVPAMWRESEKKPQHM